MVRHVLFRYTTKGALKEIVDSRGETLYINTDCQGRVEKIFKTGYSLFLIRWNILQMNLQEKTI